MLPSDPAPIQHLRNTCRRPPTTSAEPASARGQSRAAGALSSSSSSSDPSDHHVVVVPFEASLASCLSSDGVVCFRRMSQQVPLLLLQHCFHRRSSFGGGRRTGDKLGFVLLQLIGCGTTTQMSHVIQRLLGGLLKGFQYWELVLQWPIKRKRYQQTYGTGNPLGATPTPYSLHRSASQIPSMLGNSGFAHEHGMFQLDFHAMIWIFENGWIWRSQMIYMFLVWYHGAG